MQLRKDSAGRQPGKALSPQKVLQLPQQLLQHLGGGGRALKPGSDAAAEQRWLRCRFDSLMLSQGEGETIQPLAQADQPLRCGRQDGQLPRQLLLKGPPALGGPGGEGYSPGPDRQFLQPGLGRAIHRAEKSLSIGHHYCHRLRMEGCQLRQGAQGALASGPLAEEGFSVKAHPVSEHPLLAQSAQPDPQVARLLVGKAFLINQE